MKLKKLYLLISLITMAVQISGGNYASANPFSAGPITPQEVKKYFTDLYTKGCYESDACTITFDTPVRIAAAERHAFQIPATNYLCYPVKVNFTTHKNSGTYHTQHFTNAVYYFYRNGFGEWEMGKENEKITSEKDAQQLAEVAANKPGTVSANAANYPKPDFSAMESQFEIVKYEYPVPPSQDMTIYIKPKIDTRSRSGSFSVEFKDKAGHIIGVNPAWLCCSTQLGYTELGAVGKVTVTAPTQTELSKIASVTVIKH